eukprot:scaffold2208_cov170-Ochromonas_danica.AAC.9
MTLSDIDHVICVSNSCRENLSLRARLHPSLISTIPNAVDPTKFTPDPSRRYPLHTVNIVILSRLVYRKGIDLLVKVIPLVCSRVHNAHFIIGGDGNKLLLLEEMRERYQLHDRMELLGAVPHHRVRDVLVRGHIFLNCSLTESFCIALLEAASCGLYVVSTKVGGVPEVLPSSMISFAEPVVESIADAVVQGISICRRVHPMELHERVKNMYSWFDVCRRTEVVYSNIATSRRPSLAQRLLRYGSAGTFSGLLVSVWIILLHFVAKFCQLVWPAQEIERCPDVSLHGNVQPQNRPTGRPRGQTSPASIN